MPILNNNHIVGRKAVYIGVTNEDYANTASARDLTIGRVYIVEDDGDLFIIDDVGDKNRAIGEGGIGNFVLLVD